MCIYPLNPPFYTLNAGLFNFDPDYCGLLRTTEDKILLQKYLPSCTYCIINSFLLKNQIKNKIKAESGSLENLLTFLLIFKKSSIFHKNSEGSVGLRIRSGPFPKP